MRQTVAAWPQLLRAVLTLLMGGALAQLIPLLLGPVLTRLYAPTAFGVFAAFSSVVATVAVLACLRYEFALPLARDEGEARALFVLCLWICGGVALLAVPLAAVLHATGHLPLPRLLPLAVAAAGLLQLLVMWATRAQVFRALAISRVLQYGGAALLQVALGWWLWRRAQQPAGADAAWALALGPILASAAAAWVLRPHGSHAIPQGQRVGWQQVAVRYRDFPLLNTPHAFLGALQDALAVALLVAWQGDAAAGFWGLTLRYLKAPATLVGGAVSQALYPRLAQATPEAARQTVRQIMIVMGVLALILMGVLMLAGPWLFVQVFGSDWREAGYLARALAPYIAAHFVAAPLAVVTMAWQAQRWALRWAFVGQVAFIAALVLGLRQGGLIAGAWAVSVAMLLYFGIYFWRLACWRDMPFSATHSSTDGDAR